MRIVVPRLNAEQVKPGMNAISKIIVVGFAAAWAAVAVAQNADQMRALVRDPAIQQDDLHTHHWAFFLPTDNADAIRYTILQMTGIDSPCAHTL